MRRACLVGGGVRRACFREGTEVTPVFEGGEHGTALLLCRTTARRNDGEDVHVGSESNPHTLKEAKILSCMCPRTSVGRPQFLNNIAILTKTLTSPVQYPNLPARHAPEAAEGRTGKMLCCISCANCQTSEPRAQSTRHGGANSFLLPGFYDCLRSTANGSTLSSKVKMLQRICQLSTRSRGTHYPRIMKGAGSVDCGAVDLQFRG